MPKRKYAKSLEALSPQDGAYRQKIIEKIQALREAHPDVPVEDLCNVANIAGPSGFGPDGIDVIDGKAVVVYPITVENMAAVLAEKEP